MQLGGIVLNRVLDVSRNCSGNTKPVVLPVFAISCPSRCPEGVVGFPGMQQSVGF